MTSTQNVTNMARAFMAAEMVMAASRSNHGCSCAS